MEFVSWDYEISNIWKSNPNVPNHQPEWDLVDLVIRLNGDLMGFTPPCY
jgi:hypothetical protein